MSLNSIRTSQPGLNLQAEGVMISPSAVQSYLERLLSYFPPLAHLIIQAHPFFQAPPGPPAPKIQPPTVSSHSYLTLLSHQLSNYSKHLLLISLANAP